MAMDTVDVSVDGKRYKVTQLPFTESLKLFTRLTKVLGPALSEALSKAPQILNLGDDMSQAAPALSAAVGSLAQTMTADDLDSTFRTLAAKTLANTGDDKWVPLDKIMEAHFGGELPHALKWLMAALKVNYGNFLGELGLLRKLAAATPEESSEQSQSQNT